MTRPADPVSVVEAAYDAIDAPDAEWLRTIADAATAMDDGFGVAAGLIDSRRVPIVSALAFSAATSGEVIEALRIATAEMPISLQREMFAFGAAFAVDRSEHSDLRLVPGGAPMSRLGMSGAFGVVGIDGSGCGVTLSAPTVELRPRSMLPLQPWRRVAAHLATAARLRTQRASSAREPDAVLRADGALLHATGEARGSARRAELAAAARGVDRARTRAARADAARALELWKALVSGRWSLVDTIESDGKRILVAYRNETPGLAAPRLSARESQVAALVAGGRTNKEIAYELGIGLSTVETLVLRARRKLGATTRAAFAACVGARPA